MNLQWRLIPTAIIAAVSLSIFFIGQRSLQQQNHTAHAAETAVFTGSSNVCRIMPFGDSITAGIGSTNDNRGYRVPLYQALTAANFTIQFVGSQPGGSGIIPTSNDNHEGYPGKDTDYFKIKIYTLLNNNPPDVILLHLGTNDISAGDVDPNDDLALVLDKIDEYEQDSGTTIPVIIAQIINRACPPAASGCINRSQQTTTYNNNLATFVQNRKNAGDTLILVDMENDANLVYTQGVDFADDKHPNDTGYQKMSAVWLDAVRPYCTPVHKIFLPTILAP